MELEEPKVCPERCLPLLPFGNPDKTESILEVDFAEVLAALNMFEEVVHPRERVTVLLGDSVEGAVIDA